jgi:hypothetical protein
LPTKKKKFDHDFSTSKEFAKRGAEMEKSVAE